MPPKVTTKLKLKINAKSDASASEQLATQLGEMIRGGALAVGAPMPGERTLSLQLGTDRATIKRAYQRLEAEGMIETTSQIGRFVSDSTKKKPVKRKA